MTLDVGIVRGIHDCQALTVRWASLPALLLPEFAETGFYTVVALQPDWLHSQGSGQGFPKVFKVALPAVSTFACWQFGW